ncbi:MAG: hypothetical protein IJN35_05725 [Muribaculaceae bacterium]|nr:hypothetical protein [Muribaculaceae bacterium]
MTLISNPYTRERAMHSAWHTFYLLQNAGNAIPYLSLSEAYCQDVTVQKGDSNITHTDKYWVVSDSTLWPSTTETLTFLAYAPMRLTAAAMQ